mmetsp:Transcript_27204/g.58281  ORF Transcript_27204/g.58281 Transcript_27204/m.58281 type:complete len:210 (+) Transcript_27204:1527-2156(+)
MFQSSTRLIGMISVMGFAQPLPSSKPLPTTALSSSLSRTAANGPSASPVVNSSLRYTVRSNPGGNFSTPPGNASKHSLSGEVLSSMPASSETSNLRIWPRVLNGALFAKPSPGGNSPTVWSMRSNVLKGSLGPVLTMYTCVTGVPRMKSKPVKSISASYLSPGCMRRPWCDGVISVDVSRVVAQSVNFVTEPKPKPSPLPPVLRILAGP